MVRHVALILFGLLFLVGGYSFDVQEAFMYYGEKISPNSPGLGIFIFLVLMVLLIFSDDIWSFLRKKKIKVKRKF